MLSSAEARKLQTNSRVQWNTQFARGSATDRDTIGNPKQETLNRRAAGMSSQHNVNTIYAAVQVQNVPRYNTSVK